MLAACQKEETGTVTTLQITAEEFHGGDAKMGAYLGQDGGVNNKRIFFTWETGDQVRINDGVFTVTRGQSGNHENATITAPEGQPITAPVRALSPASLYDGALTADQVQVTLPDTYQWSTFTQNLSGLNKKCQKLDAPMAAYGDASNLDYSSSNGNKITFKNLCGALAVKITNTTGLPLDVEEVQVTSNRYKLSGSVWIDFTNLTGLQPQSTSTRNSVTMRFDNEDLHIDENASQVVLIPVLPVGANNQFAITVKYRNYGAATVNTDKHCYEYKRTQPNSGNNALARSQFGYAPIDAVTSASSGITLTKKWFFDDGTYKLIKDKWQLKTLGDVGDLSFGQDKIRIVRDIDMSGLTCKPMYYVNEIDGGRHTVSNLEINADATGRLGLLRSTTDATIKDLTIDGLKLNTSVLNGTSHAGGLIAEASGTTTLTNCHVDNLNVYNAAVGGSYSNDISIGGLVGRCNGPLTINGCTVINFKFSKASSSSPNYLQVNCGGMVGYAGLGSGNSISIANSSHYANQVVFDEQNSSSLVATNEIRFGGVIGYANGGTSWSVYVVTWIGTSSNPFIMESKTADVYAGHVLGRAVNNPSLAVGGGGVNLYPLHTPASSINLRYGTPHRSYLNIHLPDDKTAYIGSDDEYSPSFGTYVGHIIGNLNYRQLHVTNSGHHDINYINIQVNPTN